MVYSLATIKGKQVRKNHHALERENRTDEPSRIRPPGLTGRKKLQCPVPGIWDQPPHGVQMAQTRPKPARPDRSKPGARIAARTRPRPRSNNWCWPTAPSIRPLGRSKPADFGKCRAHPPALCRTIHAIFQRHGCIRPEASRAARPYQRFEKATPNELWQADFKATFACSTARAAIR